MRRLLIVAVLLLAANRANATISLVQHTNKDQSSAASSTTLAYGSNPAANNLLIVVVRGGSAITSITITDSIGNTWTNCTFHAVGGVAALQITYAVNSTNAADTVTVTPSASTTMRLAIYEYSGTATTSPLDLELNTNTNSSTTPAVTSQTPSANNELVFGAAATSNAAAEVWTAGTNFTLEDTVGANLTLGTEDWVQTTATATTANFTISASDSWLAAIAIFKPASGGGATPLKPPVVI
jgi:hypothetical protein